MVDVDRGAPFWVNFTQWCVWCPVSLVTHRGELLFAVKSNKKVGLQAMRPQQLHHVWSFSELTVILSSSTMPHEASASAYGCQPITKQPSHLNPLNLPLVLHHCHCSFLGLTKVQKVDLDPFSVPRPLSVSSSAIFLSSFCRSNDDYSEAAPTFLTAPDCVSTWTHSFSPSVSQITTYDITNSCMKECLLCVNSSCYCC